MARIYQALRRGTDGRWDMTVGSDEERWTHAIGYCHGWREYSEDDFRKIPGLKSEVERLRFHREKFHEDGHATAAEAEACWLRFQLDAELRFFEARDEQRKCEVCQVWTTGRAELGREMPKYWTICPEHQTRHAVENLAAADSGRVQA